jgi:hypothetical protein
MLADRAGHWGQLRQVRNQQTRQERSLEEPGFGSWLAEGEPVQVRAAWMNAVSVQRWAQAVFELGRAAV